MRIKSSLLILSLIITILTSACSSKAQQELPFDIVNESVAFPTKVKEQDKIPQLIVISELEQISQLESSEVLLVHLSEIDFQKSLVILILRGQLPDSGIVEKVIKDDHEILIRAKEIVPGPGSYVVSGFTPPYQIISVFKVDEWNGHFDFILERESGAIVNKVTEFVP